METLEKEHGSKIQAMEYNMLSSRLDLRFTIPTPLYFMRRSDEPCLTATPIKTHRGFYNESAHTRSLAAKLGFSAEPSSQAPGARGISEKSGDGADAAEETCPSPRPAEPGVGVDGCDDALFKGIADREHNHSCFDTRMGEAASRSDDGFCVADKCTPQKASCERSGDETDEISSASSANSSFQADGDGARHQLSLCLQDLAPPEFVPDSARLRGFLKSLRKNIPPSPSCSPPPLTAITASTTAEACPYPQSISGICDTPISENTNRRMVWEDMFMETVIEMVTVAPLGSPCSSDGSEESSPTDQESWLDVMGSLEDVLSPFVEALWNECTEEDTVPTPTIAAPTTAAVIASQHEREQGFGDVIQGFFLPPSRRRQ